MPAAKSKRKANQTELINRMMEITEFANKVSAKNALLVVLKAVEECCRAQGGVRLPGFGTFRVAQLKARLARNPQTGKSIKVPACRKLRFSVARDLKGTF